MMATVSVFLVLVVYFIVGWRISLRSQKVAWVDFFWVSSFLIVPWVLALSQYLAEGRSLLGPFFEEKKHFWWLALLFSVWSFRLSWHLFWRLRKHPEDPRYLALKEKWADNLPMKTLWLFLFEAFLVLILSLPLFIVFSVTDPSWHWSQLVAVSLFILGLVGETTADRQLKNFKAKQQGGGRVCDVGLWKYSRHPNYFFELVIWTSFAVYGASFPLGFWAVVPLIIMAILLIFVTGVAPSERQALASKGDLYRAYQQRTSMLIPWPPKES